MLNERNWQELQQQFLSAAPFNHVVMDDFFTDDVLADLVKEFPAYHGTNWRGDWDNAVENKRLHNVWDMFGPTTYFTFNYLLSKEWLTALSSITGQDEIFIDPGLNGAGLHSHTRGGHLNVHLDYSLHPKLKLKRNYNLIVYLTPDWDPAWGGGLGLWTHDAATNQPKELVKTVDAKFNRAVLFDTTQNSWHGLPEKLQCPEGTCRNSLALYYLTQADATTDTRGKALFAPYKEQANDPEVLDLIKRRADATAVQALYKK